MTLQPEVHIVEAEHGTDRELIDLSLPELVLIVTDQLGGDPVEIIRDAVMILKTGSTSEVGTAALIVSEMLWRAFGDRIPCNREIQELEELVDLMRD